MQCLVKGSLNPHKTNKNHTKELPLVSTANGELLLGTAPNKVDTNSWGSESNGIESYVHSAEASDKERRFEGDLDDLFKSIVCRRKELAISNEVRIG